MPYRCGYCAQWHVGRGRIDLDMPYLGKRHSAKRRHGVSRA